MAKLATAMKSGKERVLLVVLDMYEKKPHWSVEEMKTEMEECVIACGGEMVSSMVVKINKPTARYLISDTKAQEIANAVSTLGVDSVVFSYDLKGSQQRNLEECIQAKTIDRTQLILDIFARHATSKEGKLQVELAQLEYLSPRLVGKGTELSRLGGGIGTLGPGETKLEMDRRRISDRIAKLKKDLKDIVRHRTVNRQKRKERGIPMVSLVGYTNAGKSTLLNTLTDAGQLTKDGLFTTLDSLSRQFILPNRQKMVISDTVGFMNELPHHLIEAFKATLEEIKEADLLLHVLDISHPHFRHLYEAVIQVLRDLDVLDKPIITVLNKMDRMDKDVTVESFSGLYENSVCVSALNGINIKQLLEKVENALSSLYREINVDIPLDRMDLINLAHEQGDVYSVKYYTDYINLRASVPTCMIGKFEKSWK